MKELIITLDIKRLKEIHNRLQICDRARKLWQDTKELWREQKPPIKVEIKKGNS